MDIEGYSFRDKKKVKIVDEIIEKKYKLKNGNTSTIVCGKDAKGNKICVITSNKKYDESREKLIKDVLKYFKIEYKDCSSIQKYKEKYVAQCKNLYGADINNCSTKRMKSIVENPKIKKLMKIDSC